MELKRIRLSNGMYTLVDEQDYAYLSRYKWYYSNRGYAVRNGHYPTGQRSMHREIMRCGDDVVVHHISRDKLDNRRCNLRIVTSLEHNHIHRDDIRANNTSGYVGVQYHKYSNTWRWVYNANYRRYEKSGYASAKDAYTAREVFRLTIEGETK